MERLIRWTVLAGVIACLALALWAAAGLAQTTVPVESLRAVGNGRLLAIVDNRVVLVRLRGLSIVGDELQVLEPPRPPATWARITYRPTGRVAEYVIPESVTQILVYRNGLLMTEPDDYALDGAVVRFRAGQIPDAGDIVNIVYERVSQ
jgi:hypothetical protein